MPKISLLRRKRTQYRKTLNLMRYALQNMKTTGAYAEQVSIGPEIIHIYGLKTLNVNAD
jgi:hypothetical protein